MLIQKYSVSNLKRKRDKCTRFLTSELVRESAFSQPLITIEFSGIVRKLFFFIKSETKNLIAMSCCFVVLLLFLNIKSVKLFLLNPSLSMKPVEIQFMPLQPYM